MASLLTTSPVRYATLTADQSATVLARRIQLRQPFFFIRYGDGAIECINGKVSQTRDGERYSPELGKALLKAWRSVVRGPNAYVGDWLSASFDATSEYARYSDAYAELIGDAQPNWLHFEALLLMRESDSLLDFYKAVVADPRKKLFMGPAECSGAARMLGAEHLVTPMRDLFACVETLTRRLLASDFEVLLYGAGMAGNVIAANCWEQFPDKTFVNLGSAMDPLFRCWSRRQQLVPARAKAFFRELL